MRTGLVFCNQTLKSSSVKFSTIYPLEVEKKNSPLVYAHIMNKLNEIVLLLVSL